MKKGNAPSISIGPGVGGASPGRPASLLELARERGIGLEGKCGGAGKCGKCRVVVRSGATSAPTGVEKELLAARELEAGVRLACQTTIEGEETRVEISLPPDAAIGEQRIQLEGASRAAIRFGPPVRVLRVEIAPASLGDPRSDFERLRDAAKESHGVAIGDTSLAALRELPEAARAGGWAANAIVRGDELLAVKPVGEGARPHGLAVDLGTSKVAMFLVNLSTGATVASLGFGNPQIPYGEDVMTRIAYAAGGKEPARRLRALVVDEINAKLAEATAARRLAPSDVVEVTLVGNTAMHHLLLGLPVRQLGASPFAPATREALEPRAGEVGIDMLPAGRVYLPPLVGGFVGSDHLAAILASGLCEEAGPSLLVDVGTNTEVALKVGSRILCCSCASGPAFEGGALRHGMRAAAGAIETVRIAPGGAFEVATIGDAEPAGICGSGILDALVAMKTAGVIDDRGRLKPGSPGVIEERAERAFRLAPTSRLEGGWVVVTQRDVREIQKAKGAVRSGIEMLLERAGVSHDEIGTIHLAGAFGSYLDPRSALSIAMLPPVPPEGIRHAGNAAGAGARELLCSVELRRRAEELAGRIEWIELASYPKADLFFASAMMLSEESLAAYMRKWRKSGSSE